MGDLEMARGVVRQYPFATLVTADLRATHMPEAAVAEPWSLDRAGESARDMADQVIAFRLRADSWHAEAKLSQDKPGDERARVLAGLEHDPAYFKPATRRADAPTRMRWPGGPYLCSGRRARLG